MTTYEMFQQINEKAKQNIDILNTSGKIDELSKCVAFADDLQLWLSACGGFSGYLLVEKAQSECVNSIYMCAQGFYKEAITTLRQFLEHLLFAVLLSTNDYKYRLWQAGQCDMSWAQLMDDQNGVFGKQFLKAYAKDLNDERSMELLTITKNVYRECSEYVHGNYSKLSILSESLVYNKKHFDQYVEYFTSVQYVVCMALFVRFRDILNDHENFAKLESIIADNLGTLTEVQLLFSAEGGCNDE